MTYIQKGIYPSTLRVELKYSDDNDDDDDNTLFNDPPRPYICLALLW